MDLFLILRKTKELRRSSRINDYLSFASELNIKHSYGPFYRYKLKKLKYTKHKVKLTGKVFSLKSSLDYPTKYLLSGGFNYFEQKLKSL